MMKILLQIGQLKCPEDAISRTNIKSYFLSSNDFRYSSAVYSEYIGQYVYYLNKIAWEQALWYTSI